MAVGGGAIAQFALGQQKALSSTVALSASLQAMVAARAAPVNDSRLDR